MSGMDNLREILRASIDERRITVKQLAEAGGVSRQHIYNILEGKQQPTLTLAEKLAAAAGAEMVFRQRRRKKIA